MAITGKPDKQVTSLTAPARGSNNRTMSSSWKVPASMTKSDSKTKAENLVVGWKLDITGKNNIKLSKEYGTSKTSASINLNNFSVGSKSYSRSSFYPQTDKKLYSVTISVAGKNSKGTGKANTHTREFKIPKKPTIDAFSFENSTGKATTVIRTDAGAGYAERYDTKYKVTATDTRTGATTVVADTTSTSTEISVTYNASNYQSLNVGDYIKVEVTAQARGFAGHSEDVAKTFYISQPAKATLGTAVVSSKDSTGRLVVPIQTNSTNQQKVDTVKLEYLANTTYETVGDIPASASWSDSGVEDDGECTAITMPIGELIPDRGRYTWIRAKTIRLNESVLYQYSDYQRLEYLETEAAAAAEVDITILDVWSGADAKSAVVLLGWNRSGTDDSTGTELSWSDEEDTWKSTKDPEKYEFSWSDGEITHGGITYHDSAEITIKELTEGERYCIKARRYYEGETVSYGGYSAMVTIIPNGKPAGVVASCFGEIAEGDPLQVYWTFGGSGLQTAWQIVDSNGAVLKEGEGSITGTQIDAETIARHAENNILTFNVQVSTGSDYTLSASRTVRILQKPTLSVNANATLTAQPFSFTASSSRQCDLIVIVTAQGASGQFPDGFKMQINGDTIHSDVYSPAWSNGSATITLPTGLDFWDLGGYTLSVVAVDRETGLRSEPVEKDFTVAWSNKAKDPYNNITLTPIDTVSEDNQHLQGVQITLTAPTGSASTDVYDIYRMDGSKANLIGYDYPRSITFTDEYAPFSNNGELFYRIALRTVDGDVEFADKPYTLQSDTVRFDWQGGTLELPYGISIGDNYKKSVEFRQHMDGSVDGYWNQNIERGASYSSSIIRLIQPEEINLARALARYAGAVFVRTANGSAFTADVQVSDLSVKNEAVTAIAVDATEVGMTEEFMLVSPFEQEG